MTSFTPKERRRARVISSSVRPPISTSALGRWLVSGRRRVPSPAARIMAFGGVVIRVKRISQVAFYPIARDLIARAKLLTAKIAKKSREESQENTFTTEPHRGPLTRADSPTRGDGRSLRLRDGCGGA